MCFGLPFAAIVLACIAISAPSYSFAGQNGSRASMGMARGHVARAPINPPRFQAVKAGPLKGPALPPPGFRDRSIPTAALPQRIHRHPLRGPHFGVGLGYLSSYAYASYVYADPDHTYAQDPQAAYQRLTPAGQCWTQYVQVSSDRSRDVRITRC